MAGKINIHTCTDDIQNEHELKTKKKVVVVKHSA